MHGTKRSTLLIDEKDVLRRERRKAKVKERVKEVLAATNQL